MQTSGNPPTQTTFLVYWDHVLISWMACLHPSLVLCSVSAPHMVYKIYHCSKNNNKLFCLNDYLGIHIVNYEGLWETYQKHPNQLYYPEYRSLIRTVWPQSSISIIKFGDDTVVMGLISNNNEPAYLDEVEKLTSWCQSNCLSLNVSKTKELAVDFRGRQQQIYSPLIIGGTPVNRVSSFKYLNVHITEDLT